MASPQIENGYLRIANEILDVIIRQRLSGQELRLSFFIIRKTYGYNKKSDYISLSQMAKATGLSRTRCSQVINALETKRIVTLTENLNGKVKKFRFNKDYEEWQTVTKNCRGIRKTNETLTENLNHKIQLQKTKDTCLSSEGKDSRVKPLIDFFFSLCKEIHDQEPAIEGRKDGSAIKRILDKYPLQQVQNMLDFYLRSEKAIKNGLSIAVALSNHSITEYDQKGKWRYEG